MGALGGNDKVYGRVAVLTDFLLFGRHDCGCLKSYESRWVQRGKVLRGEESERMSREEKEGNATREGRGCHSGGGGGLVQAAGAEVGGML